MWAPDAAFALLFLALVGNHRSDSMPLRHIGQFHSESWLLYAASSMMWGRTLPGSEAAPSACGGSHDRRYTGREHPHDSGFSRVVVNKADLRRNIMTDSVAVRYLATLCHHAILKLLDNAFGSGGWSVAQQRLVRSFLGARN